jgi:hypothetical protein
MSTGRKKSERGEAQKGEESFAGHAVRPQSQSSIQCLGGRHAMHSKGQESQPRIRAWDSETILFPGDFHRE